MKYRKLGNTGLIVSEVALGTMQFGGKMNMGNLGQEDTNKLVKLALDRGINFIDTADVYSRGESETLLGNALKGVRPEIVLATKVRLPMSDNFNRSGATRVNILRGVESSLKRLQTDYIDLYQVHGWDSITPFEETLRALDDLVRQGKVRYLGCSNLFGWQVAKAAGVARCMGLEPLAAGQYIYSLIHRELERELVPALVDHGIGLTAYSPLGGGLLTGKYRGQREPAAGTRHAFRTQVDGPRFWHEQGFRTAEILEQEARESGIPMAQLAIGWPLGRRFVSSVVIGVKSADQLASNLAAADWDMPVDLWRSIEERTRPAEDYLSWFNRRNYERMFGCAEFHDNDRLS